jgi:glycosyltransferase involved in cell wall biosynthesis
MVLTVSVVVPVHNGAAFLPRCLESLRASKRPLECIVVDDRSSDTSAAIAEAAGAVVLHARGGRGPAAARNLGAAHASGDLLVFVDADVCVRPDTIDRIGLRFEMDPRLDALIGSYDDEPAGDGFVSQYKNLLHHFVHQHGREEAATFWAACGAIRREVFEAAGGFDEAYTRACIEDVELGYRLRQGGRRIVLDPAIQVKHLKSYRLRSLLRSDIVDRALPWTRLILASRTLPDDLNLKLEQRVSAALVLGAAALASACAATGFPIAWACLPLLGAIILNRGFFSFLAGKRGWSFAAGAAPLQWAYYVYSTLAFAAGAALYAMDLPDRRRRLRDECAAIRPDTPPCS